MASHPTRGRRADAIQCPVRQADTAEAVTEVKPNVGPLWSVNPRRRNPPKAEQRRRQNSEVVTRRKQNTLETKQQRSRV